MAMLMLGGFAVGAYAQELRSIGIVNGYATLLPKPVVTAREEAACMSGQVKIEVLINERGRVISAKPVSGPLVLFRSSLAAARRARFRRGMIDAPAVKQRGYLVYNFQLPNRCSAAKAKIIWLCNINAKVIKIPKPEYPPAALAVRAHGKVDVQIEIDETGKVVSATAVSGHPFLRYVSEAAAREALFEPVVLSDGRVIKATGTITYNFLPQ